MDIGLKIKQLREEKGLSQDGLAEQLHVTRQAVSKWNNFVCRK
jgi:DNA-binding transcriptional regulator YiaG